MIPKVIHYCWFGGKAIPYEYRKYIASWKKYCPEYEIKEWNEKNFDMGCCSYVKEAYEAKKWAFVADYVRFCVLYKYGGVYFDTDVELLRPIDDLLEKGNFLGVERYKNTFAVNPGLGMGAVAGVAFYKKILELYENIHFRYPDGTQNTKTVVDYTTTILEDNGYIAENKLKKVCDIYIYIRWNIFALLILLQEKCVLWKKHTVFIIILVHG